MMACQQSQDGECKQGMDKFGEVDEAISRERQAIEEDIENDQLLTYGSRRSISPVTVSARSACGDVQKEGLRRHDMGSCYPDEDGLEDTSYKESCSITSTSPNNVICEKSESGYCSNCGSADHKVAECFSTEGVPCQTSNGRCPKWTHKAVAKQKDAAPDAYSKCFPADAFCVERSRCVKVSKQNLSSENLKISKIPCMAFPAGSRKD